MNASLTSSLQIVDFQGVYTLVMIDLTIIEVGYDIWDLGSNKTGNEKGRLEHTPTYL